ncbi:hypothetical protein HZS_2610, partial [Henneguya salminicola]
LDTAHLIIPEQYKISFRNKNFISFDGSRFIILTPTSLSTNICFDSIFKSVSKFFSQLCVIQEECNNVFIPCFFALIEQKPEIMHRRVWEKVRGNVEIT